MLTATDLDGDFSLAEIPVDRTRKTPRCAQRANQAVGRGPTILATSSRSLPAERSGRCDGADRGLLPARLNVRNATILIVEDGDRQEGITNMHTTHQPDQAVFKSILPEDLDWEPFPSFPPSMRLAVVVGHLSEHDPYVVRVKAPSGVKLMPHRHHEDRVYTVISGVFYIGRGEQFDETELEAYPPGTVVVLPGNTPHFHWAKSGEYVTQIQAIGPISLDYVNAADDPRN